jgi:hypothetical protein
VRDPSNFRATSLRYHPKMVSGRAAVATSPRALRPRSMADFAERHSLGVPQTPLQLSPQDPIFASQVLVVQKQFLVRSR